MLDFSQARWVNPPKHFQIKADQVSWHTEPGTDYWQRTYYSFRHDNAHSLVIALAQQEFTFTVKTHFKSNDCYDQCGIVIYQDSDNWMKATIEREGPELQHLGCVVTNNGYSDWSTSHIGHDVETMYYRLSRRGADFRLENAQDGIHFQQMRIFHLFAAQGPVQIGLFACSALEASFEAHFSEITFGKCLWAAHQP